MVAPLGWRRTVTTPRDAAAGEQRDWVIGGIVVMCVAALAACRIGPARLARSEALLEDVHRSAMPN